MEEVALKPMELEESNKPGVRTNQLNLTFEDVSYSVRAGLLYRKKKKILTNVSGDFRPGELTAIMGPSGAGKTTLMNVLSGFATANSTGVVRVNGRTRDFAAFRRSSAYIMQDGHLQPYLTVQEVMQIAADLKLDTSPADKQLGVDVIIKEMGLDKARTTCTGHLSGGEQKRLTIALELISNPPIMFFDEPTSGLDSVASRQCIGVLKSLARDGRTVVCTIHQPSALQFEMFDHLYVIANGLCVYSGAPRNLVKYLEELGLSCPTDHNPADYVLEIISGQYGDQIPNLAEAAEHGQSQRWRDGTNEGETQNLKIRELDVVPKLPLPETSIFYEFDAKGSATYVTSFWKQWIVLMRRNIIKLSRDSVLMHLRLFIHFIVAFIIGVVFFNKGNDGAHARSNFNVMFFNIMTVMFNAFNSTIITFPKEMPILKREHFNRWYKLRSYFVALKLTDFPIQITAVSIYIITVWLLTGQIMDLWRLGLTTLICILLSLVSQTVGLLCGTVLNVKMGVIFGPLTILPFMIFSGFFVQLADAPAILQWLFHISIFKYSFEAVMIAIYGYDREKMTCSTSEDDGLSYCHYSAPKTILKEFHMLDSDYWFAASVLFGLYIVLNIISYCLLHFKLRKR